MNHQDINADFRNVSGDVQLWSFFESVPTAGVLIVPQESAVLSESLLSDMCETLNLTGKWTYLANTSIISTPTIAISANSRVSQTPTIRSFVTLSKQ
jgi:hypothetical protein